MGLGLVGGTFGRLGALPKKPGGFPIWLPSTAGTLASPYADFTTEGTTNHYWYNGAQYGSFAAWLAAVSGTFTRASTAYYVGSDGLLHSAASGAIRFDYDPVTLAAKGLLLEGARTNVVLWNRDLTNAAWTASNVSVAKNQTGADGAANAASSLTATAGNGTVLQAITLSSSARYQSAYVKRLTGAGTINMTMDNGATWTAITPTASWTPLAIPTQTLANPTVGFRIVTNGDAIAVDFVGNENGTFRTSPTPTTTTAVTRAADSLTATPISSWYTPSAGTLLGFGDTLAAPQTGGGGALVLLGGQSVFEQITFSASVAAIRNLVGNGSLAVLETLNPAVANTNYRTALAFAANNNAAVTNGGTVVTDATIGAPSTHTSFAIGTGGANGGSLVHHGHVSVVGYFPVRASNAELQRLTT